MAHILFDVSGHGFGHLAQTAAVVEGLAGLRPELRLTVRAEHDPAILRRFLPEGTAIDRPPPDPTLVMTGPIDVDAKASMARYAALHGDWQRVIDAEAQRMEAVAPDLVVSDVGYVSLAAAQRLGVPACAMCSLDWYGIFRTYCARFDGAAAIAGQIMEAYGAAEAFLQLVPHMPMDYFPHRRVFGPVGRLGRDRRAELERAHPFAAGKRLVVFSLGGIPGGPRAADLPANGDVCWLCDAAVQGRAEGVVAAEDAGMPFIDLLATADAVITKPGYGTLVEALCNGTAFVSLERPDWPETEWLQSWACSHGRARFVPRTGNWIDAAVAAVAEVLALPPVPAPEPTGCAEVAEFLIQRIDGNG